MIERKANPTKHFVIGNDAGDADSIISAITLAYVESKHNGDETPIVSISKDVFTHERPDVNLLLQLAGFHDLSDKLLFIDDLKDVLENVEKEGLLLNGLRSISLVDHNTLNKSLQRYQKGLIVTDIVDHHKDDDQYNTSCNGTHRNIAFDSGHALVASATTLVAERLQRFPPPYPSFLGILLLGVILLDSVNLDESVGKVTDRDRDAVSDLILHSDWSNAMPSSYLHHEDNGDFTIDTDELFKKLQHAKYDPMFWDKLSVVRALGYDYKEEGHKTRFGISSILMPGLGFMNKERFYNSTLTFMESKRIQFLGIMFAFYEEDVFHRQLAFVSADQTVAIHELAGSILASSAYNYVDLQLEEVHLPDELYRSPKLQIRLYDQNNVVPSRKQIGPMLEDYFDEINLFLE